MKLIAGRHINRRQTWKGWRWGTHLKYGAENQIDRPTAMLLLAAASSVGTLAPQAGFFAGPVVAQWRERFGPKRVVLGGAALIAAGFALLGVAREVSQFCVLYGLLGVTAGMTGTVPLATSFSNGLRAAAGW